MALIDRIAAGRAFDRTRFIEFVVDGEPLGLVRVDLIAHLRQFATIFTIEAEQVGFKTGLNDVWTRSEAMADVAKRLAAQGLLSRWRNETYDVAATGGGPARFVLERAAVRFFGCAARAIHVNGLVGAPRATHMWIARRAHDKAIDPGMLDNMVGGGLASGLSIEHTVVKEAWEEAGVPASVAQTAQARGTLSIRREVPDGLHVETIYVFDLTLPPGFVPVNQDGEVAQFQVMALPEVLGALADDAPFTVDAGLVALDCLARHGLRAAVAATRR